MDRETLRAQAVAMRRAGNSRREIRDELGLANWDLNEFLLGEPPPAWTKRPNAKDDLREQARDLPPTPIKQRRQRMSAALREHWEPIKRQRRIQAINDKLAAVQEIGDLSARDPLMAGALIYWCEGAKDKSYRHEERVTFINSDAALIKLFLRFLDTAGVDRERVRFRVHIHETADVETATLYWADVVDADPAEFQRPTIKRHRSKTNRKNVAQTYHGCLGIYVSRGAELYRKIEGWAYGAVLGGRSDRRWAQPEDVDRDAM